MSALDCIQFNAPATNITGGSVSVFTLARQIKSTDVSSYGKLSNFCRDGLDGVTSYGLGRFSGSYTSFKFGTPIASTSSYTPTLKKWFAACGTLGTNGHSLYIDGKLVSNVATTCELVSEPTYRYSIGSDGGTRLGGYEVSCNFVYKRTLSPNEVKSISENPWQIYEPEIVWIEVPDGTGGTAYTSSADAGTVTLTGSATTNYHAYVSSADTGSVTLTGSTTSDYRGLVSHADTGTVTITGNAATDYRGLVSHAGAGSVILAGSTSTDYRNLVSSADTSTVTLTGYAAMDTITGAGSYTSNAEAGSITLSGVTTTNYRTLISGAGTGAVTVTGFTATDTVTAAGAYTSEAAAGTILLTGLSVTSHRSSVADSSAIQIVGSDATGYFGFTSGAEPSAVIITGAETSVLRTWISDAIPGSIVIHGYETSGISPIYEISKIFTTARLSGPSATGRITTPTIGIRLT